MLPDKVQKFIDFFSELPSIGPRQATRLAFYLIRRGKTAIASIAGVTGNLADIKTCSQCFFPYELIKRNFDGKTGLCQICANPKRRQDIIAVVEKETDFMSIEKTKKFQGRYLILGELSKDGILESEQKLRLSHLKNSIQKNFGQAEEIIVAFSPTTLGDLEASLIFEELKPMAKKITRLGRGLPTGGEIEFADEDTLSGALENRR
ncbi:MAG TPA: toprim domain-containing protein [Candidatus Paceibacterota bacterium]